MRVWGLVGLWLASAAGAGAVNSIQAAEPPHARPAEAL